MAYAYYEKLARINLTTGTITVEKLDTDLAKKFIGGRGLGTKIVYDEGCATADALGPDNKLVYVTGPLTGAGAPSSGRYMVVTKSPLTGMIACSNSGGIWGAKLKYAGWDALIVEGKAPEWTYINIVDDKIELLDAREYLGLFSEELDEKLKEKHGKDSSVLSIGIAGEKKVLLAAIMNDKDRAAGRSGVGAVMGSKKLKGIVVTASKKNADEVLASAEALKAANKDVMVNIRENGLTGGGLRALGTASLVNVINGVGSLPTKNWQEAYYDKAEDISGEALAEKYLVKAGACHRCPIACGRIVKVGDKVVGGPEYEPLWAYGANMANNDLAAVNEANYWCNEYGLDAISVPCTIAAAMELYQRGAIKEEVCAGYPLEWGSVPALIEWTKRMGDPDQGLFMTKTQDPRGTWETPVLVKEGKGMIDCCPLWDDDGKAYISHGCAGSRAGVKSVLFVAPMSPDGTHVTGPSRIVYDGHEDQPTIEGTKFYKRNGYYYIMSPAGGVKYGWQVELRSKNPFGPYDEYVGLAQGKSKVNGPHQGAWVDTQNGEDWFRKVCAAVL